MKKFGSLLIVFASLLLVSCDEVTELFGLEPNLTDGLYAHYTFEGNTNNTVTGAPKAQQINSPKYVDGLNGGQAIKFSAKENSYLSVTQSMIDGGTFTVSFWAANQGDGHIFHIENGSSLRYEFGMKGGFFCIEDREFVHEAIDYSTWNMITITSKCTDNYTHEFKLYINGEMVDLCSRERSTYEYKKFIFGGVINNWSTSNMIVDNLRIYNTKALSDYEVEHLYDLEK